MVNLGDFVEVSFKGKVVGLGLNFKGKKIIRVQYEENEAFAVEENIFPVPTPEK